MLRQLGASQASVVVGLHRLCAARGTRPRGSGAVPAAHGAARCSSSGTSAGTPPRAGLGACSASSRPRRAMAAAAAATAPAAASEQEVQLHAVAGSDALLAEFQQRFQPAEGFRCTLSPAPLDASLDAAAYSAALSTRQLGQLLLSTPSIASTQEFMRRHASVLPEGAACVAERQTSGKGRGGNQWTSPDGCLMFTAGRRLKVPGSQAPFINYVVCLAVVRGIADACAPWLGGADPDVSIKWPNDIYSGGLKIGGALIHTTWQGDRFNVLAGIGLNVSNRAPTTCLEEVVARQAAAASGGGGGGGRGVREVKLARGAVLAHVLNHLERCYDEFEARGFGGLEPAYLASWMHSGQVVEVEEGAVIAPAGGGGGGVPGGGGGGGVAPGSGGRVRLTVAGLSESGFLLAEDSGGGRWELTPDGNSLDMMQGLVRRKL